MFNVVKQTERRQKKKKGCGRRLKLKQLHKLLNWTDSLRYSRYDNLFSDKERIKSPIFLQYPTHVKADLHGTSFAYDYRARLAYVMTFDHPHAHNFLIRRPYVSYDCRGSYLSWRMLVALDSHKQKSYPLNWRSFFSWFKTTVQCSDSSLQLPFDLS